MIDLNRDDPVLGLIESEVPTATIEEDADGYQRVRFTPDGKAHLEKYLDEEHTLAEADYKPVIDEALRCERIYEAMSDGEELLTIPICKGAANQIIAYLVQRIWGKDTVFTVKPEEQRQFKMLDPSGPQMPGMSEPASRMLIAWSDEVAEALEKLIEHKVRKRLPFYEVLVNVTTQMVKGVAPAWVKVAYERRTRLVKQTKVMDLGGEWYAPSGTEEVEVPHGDPHKLIFRNTPDIILPADAMDEQEAPWLSESMPMDSLTLRHKVSSGEYDLTEDELQEVLKATENMSEPRRQAEYAKIDKREARKPRNLHNVREVWAFWPIVQEGGEIAIYSVCLHYHRKAKKILKCYINPNRHGLRPYVPFFQRKRPDRFSGGSCVQDAAPFQKVVSVAMHLQLNNAAQANMVAFMVRQGSTAWNWLSKHKVGPGGMVAMQQKGEVEPFRLGTDFRSMGEEINVMFAESDKITTVGDADRDVPNRTAVGTTDIVQQARRLQINMTLESARFQWGKVAKLLVQQMQQYDVYGESIPFQDPKTRALVMLPLRMPIETIADQFTFILSASSEDDTKDQKFQRLMQAQKTMRETRRETISNLAPMFAPQSPPAVRKVLRHSIIAEEDLAGELLETLGIVNRDKYIMTADFLDEVDAEHQQWIQQKQAEMAANPQVIPPKVVLTAKLTPDQEAHAAQNAGVGAPPPAAPQSPQGAPPAPPQGGPVAQP